MMVNLTLLPRSMASLAALAFSWLLCTAAWSQTPAAVVSAAKGAENTLKIGVIGPFTGASADFGVPMLNGIQQAVDEINAVGGYLGRKLEIVARTIRPSPMWV